MTDYITTKAGLILVDATTERQKNNGTRIFTLLTNEGVEIFGIYKSGYVRRLNNRRMYQLNQRREVPTERSYEVPVRNSQGEVISTVTRTKTRVVNVRSLIPNSKDRLNYLLEFIDRNYAMQVCRKK